MAWYGLTGSVLLLTFLYFIQGLPYGVQVHFLPIYLRTRGIDLTSVGLLRLLQVPWLLKVLWAPLVDVYATRRRWLLASIVALAISCVLSGLCPPDGLGSAAILALFLWNLFASMEDVAVDSVAVTLLSDQELGAGNVAQVVGYKLGAAFAGGVLALLAGVTGWFGVCIALAAVYTEAAMLVFVSPLLRQLDSKPPQNQLASNPADANSFHDRYVPFLPCEQCTQEGAETLGRMHYQHHHHHHQHQHLHSPYCYHEISPDNASQSSLKKLASLSDVVTVIGEVFRLPDMKWLIIFLLLYKLGEQGALGMMPLFLLDQKVDATEVSFWTGIVCQGVSVCGSLVGGWLVTTFSDVPVQFTIQQMCLLRLLPIGIQLLLIVLTTAGLLTSTTLFYPAMLSLLLLTLLSGVITTATFTLMMQSSRRAPPSAQATHYSLLATAEVVGKLGFTSLCGWLADCAGYRLLFLLFAFLSAVTLHWLGRCPYNVDESQSQEDDVQSCDKTD